MGYRRATRWIASTVLAMSCTSGGTREPVLDVTSGTDASTSAIGPSSDDGLSASVTSVASTLGDSTTTGGSIPDATTGHQYPDPDPDPETGETYSACVTHPELTDVVVEFGMNLVAGEESIPPFVRVRGSYACLRSIPGGSSISIVFDEDIGGAGWSIVLDVRGGAGTYQLPEDAGVGGQSWTIRLLYVHPTGPASALGFQSDQTSTGIIDVLHLGVDGDAQVEFTAVGEIAGPDGWAFDVHFTAMMPAE